MFVCTYVRTYVCMYVCMYVCIYIYIYIYKIHIGWAHFPRLSFEKRPHCRAVNDSIYESLSLFMCVCVCVCVYIYICIFFLLQNHNIQILIQRRTIFEHVCIQKGS